ncbi:MAG TPA: hypothetical protein VGR95_18410 [Thermoanaerobaculia bacterium]|nr:hypothetical protein [Thermoanaerobaculia bacterium]
MLGPTAIALVFFAAGCQQKETANAVKPPVRALKSMGATALSPTLPPDIPGGAPGATLAGAAAFAWQEFFALNWPAVPQNGQVNTRGVADASRPFGDPTYTGPLVWETYRSKIEIFPGNGQQPPGYTANGADYGFDAAPVYNYLQSVPPCNGQSPTDPTPFVNLDEVTQIGLDTMYAGIVPPAPTPQNSDPQRLRFLAKANRAQYDYVAANQYWNHGGNFYSAVNTYTNSLKTNQVPPPSAGTVIFFPAGTVEVKAGWRMLAPTEDASHFHTQTVRYYENAGGGTPANPKPCYRDATWGLVALHIIHKTPTAPSFIFATFEQADNIRSAANGQPVEDANGNIINPPPAGTQPTSPYPTYQDGYNATTHQPDPTVTVGNQPFCTNHGSQVFYQNLSPGLPKGTAPGSGVCINTRYFQIPSDVVAANVHAHQQLTAAGAGGPWQYYKLVNVQYRPFDVANIDHSNPNSPNNPATFALANIVVETNNTLQAFQGALIATGPDAGVKTSYNNAGGPFTNVHVAGAAGTPYQAFNMGGCMGCHGNAQVAGTDFSFILDFGGVNFPEYPEASLDASRTAHYLKGFPPLR